jgi:hypothetical protein
MAENAYKNVIEEEDDDKLLADAIAKTQAQLPPVTAPLEPVTVVIATVSPPPPQPDNPPTTEELRFPHIILSERGSNWCADGTFAKAAMCFAVFAFLAIAALILYFYIQLKKE